MTVESRVPEIPTPLALLRRGKELAEGGHIFPRLRRTTSLYNLTDGENRRLLLVSYRPDPEERASFTLAKKAETVNLTGDPMTGAITLFVDAQAEMSVDVQVEPVDLDDWSKQKLEELISLDTGDLRHMTDLLLAEIAEIEFGEELPTKMPDLDDYKRLFNVVAGENSDREFEIGFFTAELEHYAHGFAPSVQFFRDIWSAVRKDRFQGERLTF